MDHQTEVFRVAQHLSDVSSGVNSLKSTGRVGRGRISLGFDMKGKSKVYFEGMGILLSSTFP
ncbi:MAG: hypothetical protein ACOC5L_01815 [Halobacteriota archaeon]